MGDGTSQVLVLASKFIITDGTNFSDAFQYSGGVLTVKNARITNLDATNLSVGGVTASSLASGAVGSASRVNPSNFTVSSTTFADITGARTGVAASSHPAGALITFHCIYLGANQTTQIQVVRTNDSAVIYTTPAFNTNLFLSPLNLTVTDGSPLASVTNTYKVQALVSAGSYTMTGLSLSVWLLG
jgi:hypothetical protein